MPPSYRVLYADCYQPSDASQLPNAIYREERRPLTTPSWLAWAQAQEVEEWLAHVGGVLEKGWNDQSVSISTSPLVVMSLLMHFCSILSEWLKLDLQNTTSSQTGSIVYSAQNASFLERCTSSLQLNLYVGTVSSVLSRVSMKPILPCYVCSHRRHSLLI